MYQTARPAGEVSPAAPSGRYRPRRKVTVMGEITSTGLPFSVVGA
jgi:hypothetical protein